MMKSRAALLSLTALALTLGIAGTALADDAATNSTTANANSVGPGITDHLVVKFISSIYGPPVSDPVSPMYNDNHGAQAGSLFMEDVLYTGYRFNKKVSLYVANDFFHYPISGQKLVMNDPMLRVSHASLYSAGQFNLAGYAGAYLPLSDKSIKDTKLGGLGMAQVATLDIGKSRWSVFSLFKETGYFYGEGAPATANDFLFQNFTSLNYQWKPNLAIWFGGEFVLNHTIRTPLDSIGVASGNADMEVGISWDISKKLNFSPYVMMYPQDGITPESSQICAMLTANIF